MAKSKHQSTNDENLPLKNTTNHAVISHDTGIVVFDDLDTGWAWMTMLASFGALCLIGGSMFSIGIIHSTLMDRFRENVWLTSWAGALHNAIVLSAGPLSSAVMDRFSCRTAIVASGVCYVIGYLGTAFAPNIETAIFTCGIIAGIGGALGFTASIVVVGFNFKTRLKLAIGFALSGSGVGLFLIAPVLQLSRDYYGPTGFFIILATCTLNIIPFGVICCPSKLEKYAQRKRKLEARIQAEGRQKLKTFDVLSSYAHTLLKKPIICLCCVNFSYCLGTYLVYLYLPTYIVDSGFTQVEAAMFLSISGVLTVTGRLMAGVITSFLVSSDIYLFSGTMGMLSIGTFVLPQYAAMYWGQVLYAVVLGVSFGSFYVLITTVNIQLVGVTYLSSAIGMQFFFGGIGAVVGPVFAGMIVDLSGAYDKTWYMAASCILLAAISGATTLCFTPTKTGDKTVVIEINVPSDQTKMLNEDTALDKS